MESCRWSNTSIAPNEETFVAIQVEDQHGVANAEAIAAVAGVDVIFLGPRTFRS